MDDRAGAAKQWHTPCATRSANRLLELPED